MQMWQAMWPPFTSRAPTDTAMRLWAISKYKSSIVIATDRRTNQHHLKPRSIMLARFISMPVYTQSLTVYFCSQNCSSRVVCHARSSVTVWLCYRT